MNFFFSLAAGIDVAAAPTSFVDFVPTVAEIVFAVVVDADLRSLVYFLLVIKNRTLSNDFQKGSDDFILLN